LADVFKDPRKLEYLNAEGADRPLRSPIPHSTLVAARAYRKRRVVEQVAARGCTAILLFDPVNIRYALDARNMQVWAAHNPFHYALLFADGHGIDFEYRGAEHLVDGLETVDEVRPAFAWFYQYSAENLHKWAETWADEIVSALREREAGPLRLAVDKLEPPGVDALRRRGVTLVEGQELTEHARLIKSAEEVELMRWTIRVCEAGMARIYEASVSGKTEQEIWAELHHENARSGGEWLETRLLTVGRRTNPWFQECSDQVAARGDLLAFDTDMIGPYGYCADLSRSWTIDHVPMTPEQRTLYAAALEQVEHNLALIRPGMDWREYTAELADPRALPGQPLLVPPARRGHVRRVSRRLRPAGRGRLPGRPLRARHGAGRREPGRRAGRARGRQARDPGARDRLGRGAARLVPVGGRVIVAQAAAAGGASGGMPRSIGSSPSSRVRRSTNSSSSSRTASSSGGGS
jgi:Xaa-Pro aminopeptidase